MTRFGILLTFQSPPSSGVAVADAYADALSQAALAEELGFDSVWVTEHHFQDDAYLPAPLIACAAIAARTSQIRIGTAVLLVPMTNPVRLAEEVATVDVLSRGRIDLGIGMGYLDEEFAGLCVPRAQRRSLFEEGIEVLEKAWAGDEFDHEGRNWSLRSTRVRPRPVQSPHPPLWFGAKSEAGMRRAAARHAPFVLPMTPPLADVAAQAQQYRALLQPNTGQPAPPIALLRETWVADSAEAAWDEVADAFRYAYTVTYGPDQIPYFEGDRRVTDPNDEFMQSSRFRRDRMLYGSPDDVARDAQRFLDATGADELICRFQLPGLASSAVATSMARFAAEVAPQLR